jgi:hypothetical protein
MPRIRKPQNPDESNTAVTPVEETLSRTHATAAADFDGLASYDQLCREIASYVSVDETLQCVSHFEGLRVAARKANNRQLEIDAGEIRLRAERRVGELMALQRETVGLNTGGRPTKETPSTENAVSERPTLTQAGITNYTANRARKLAAIPPDKFDETMAEWRKQAERSGRVSVALPTPEDDLGIRRHEWLVTVAEHLVAERFVPAGYAVGPYNIGFGGKGGRTLGCAHRPRPEQADDAWELLIRPFGTSAEIIDTVAHELCHVVAPGVGHRKAFQRVALTIGISPTPYDFKPTTEFADWADNLVKHVVGECPGLSSLERLYPPPKPSGQRPPVVQSAATRLRQTLEWLASLQTKETHRDQVINHLLQETNPHEVLATLNRAEDLFDQIRDIIEPAIESEDLDEEEDDAA